MTTDPDEPSIDPDEPPGEPDEQPHYALPPEHNCRACSRPWPCSSVQLDLVTEFYGDPAGLAAYLGRMYEVAVADRSALGLANDHAAMYARYFGWIRMARRPTGS